MQKLKKILYVIDNLDVGGAEKLLVNTINDLPEYHHTLIILNGPETLKEELPNNINYYKLNFKLNGSVIKKVFQIGSLKDLRRIIVKEKPDVVHTHLFWSTFYARLVCPKNIKFISTIHGMIGDRVFKHSVVYRMLENTTISKHQHIIGVSNSVLENYKKFIPFKGSTSVNYNYIPTSFFEIRKQNYKAAKVFKIVSVGNIKPIKNYEVLIKAMVLLGENFQLDIYGTGDHINNLNNLIDEQNIKNVNFKGNIKNISEVLIDYDLFVMSSNSEGYGLALVEAMALALPVLLSNIATFKEITDNKLEYFNCDDFKTLAEMIRKMSEDEAYRKYIGDDCLAIATKNVSKENYIQSLKALYK